MTPAEIAADYGLPLAAVEEAIMAATVIVLMIATDMRVLQPVHPDAEIAIIFGRRAS